MHEDNGHHHDHGHSHEHEHEKDHAGFDPEQLRTLIPYLIKHNLDHVDDLKKWHKQTMKSGFNDIASEFRKIIKLSEKIDRHFNSALEKMKKHGQ
ncbi:MAG: hypothetical protein V1874_05130 [Spirochaetota bacterium]